MEDTFLADSGRAYFCLKVADSRRQDWRVEQRFDKLFEGLEILCRYIKHSKPSMATRVAEALDYVAPSEKARLNATIADDRLSPSLKALSDRVIAGLEHEAASAAYTSDHLAHIREVIALYRKNVHDFEKFRTCKPEKAATALLRFFVGLRNSRFHAHAGTSGAIIWTPMAARARM